MRELVLNDASIVAADQSIAIDWLEDIAKGMSSLFLKQVVQNTLRTSRPLQKIHYRGNCSLWEIILALRQQGLVEEYRFLMRSIVKSPLENELKDDIKDRFLLCEGKTFPPPEGDPLVLCAISDGIAVSFPSDLIWDSSLIKVDFYELKDDESGDISKEETFEEIDNLARSNHASPIYERHRQSFRGQITSYAELWNNRKLAFSNLLFGPDVEDHLKKLNTSKLRSIVGKLSNLNAAAAEWPNVGGSAPPWEARAKVVNESEALQNNTKLRERRRFKSYDGTRQLFLWHTRFSDSGRIHLRFDPSSHEIEIGYIGQHLPLS
ncbi:MAG: hypothetical protein OXI72_20165 [Gemmatimonadota bacterium]|nr:hypothetical protein [Gemmatimonadota bacterium]